MALSGGSRVKVAPVAELILSTNPAKLFDLMASTSISTFALILILVIVPNFYFLVYLWKIGARVRFFIPAPKFLILPKFS